MSNKTAIALTHENIVDAINGLRSRAVEPFAIFALEPPAISPRFLPELKKCGYVEGDKWTLAGIEWLYGIPVTDSRDER